MDQINDDGGLTWNIIESVADVKNVDSIELNPPLGTVIDGDALESLVTSMSKGHVSFQYSGCEVTAFHDGRVEVKRIADELEL